KELFRMERDLDHRAGLLEWGEAAAAAPEMMDIIEGRYASERHAQQDQAQRLQRVAEPASSSHVGPLWGRVSTRLPAARGNGRRLPASGLSVGRRASSCPPAAAGRFPIEQTYHSRRHLSSSLVRKQSADPCP